MTEDVAAPEVRGGGAARFLDVVALGTAAIMPLLFIGPFLDPFRQPKLLLLHGAGIVLIAAIAVMNLLGVIRLRDVIRTRLPELLVVIIAGYTIVSALASVHRRTSLFAVLTALGACALFLVLRWRARRYSIHALWIVIGAGCINSIVALVQELKIWNRLVPAEWSNLHVATTGLLGNPNDVGSFLVPCVMVAMAWLLATRSKGIRVLLAGAILILGVGVLASRTRGAFLGVAAGMAMLAVVRWRRAAIERIVALAIIGVLAIATYKPAVDRVFNANIELLVSGRIVAFAAAWRMFTESPVLGVGPGCFEYAYFDYATKVYPSTLEYAVAGKQMMFGEAHNDHLQILAETGAIGYLLFLAALAYLASLSLPRPGDAPERVRFARLAAAPVAAALFALALFQFPLYLAAPLTAFVFVAALAAGWSEDDEPLAA